jgi:hypothetical protein
VQTKTAMHNLNNAAKADENSGLDNTPPNSDFEVNMIIREIEGEILLQVRTMLLARYCMHMCFISRVPHVIMHTHTHTEGSGQVAAENTAGEAFGSVGKISGAACTSRGNKRNLVWRKTKPIVNNKPCEKGYCTRCWSPAYAVVCGNAPTWADFDTRTTE